jgi:hypothetical protein
MHTRKPHIVAVVSDGRQFPAAAFLADRLKRLNPREDTEVVVFSDSRADLALAQQWGALGCDLRLLEGMPSFFGSGRISAIAFCRVFLPRLTGARKLLYLDVDTYPESEAIWSLFDVDMGDYPIAAVRDIEATCLDTPNQRSELQKAGRLFDRRYFNSGVLLIDGPRYLADDVEGRTMAIIAKGGAHDQMALNRAMNGKWLELSPAFNMTPIAYLAGVPRAVPPVISHFAGNAKPWNGPLFYLKHKARAEIEAFIPLSPWPRFLDGSPTADRVTYRPWTPPASFLTACEQYLSTTRFAVMANLHDPISPHIL